MTQFVYASNWRKTCIHTLTIMPRCVCNPVHKASVVHHLKYKRSLLRRLLGCILLHNPFQVSVSGYEITGWDIVPICCACHENSYGRSLNSQSVHYIKVWIQKGGLRNRNTYLMQAKLRFLFWFWVLLFIPFKILFLCCHPSKKLLKKRTRR